MTRPPAVTDDEIVDAIRSADDPVLTTAEISDRVGLGARGLRDRLQELADRDRVVTKKVGSSRVYYSPELRELQQRRQDAADEPGAPREDSSPPDDRDVDETAPDAADARERVGAVLDELDLPGSGPILQERRRAVLAAVELIARSGGASRSEIVEDVYPEIPAGYASDYSLWKNLLQPALQQLADEIDELATTGQRWIWSR